MEVAPERARADAAEERQSVGSVVVGADFAHVGSGKGVRRGPAETVALGAFEARDRVRERIGRGWFLGQADDG